MKTQLEALEQLHFSWLVEREQTKVNLTLLKQKDPEQVVNSEQRNILGKTATINTTVADEIKTFESAIDNQNKIIIIIEEEIKKINK